jgi:hypothetical protein
MSSIQQPTPRKSREWWKNYPDSHKVALHPRQRFDWRSTSLPPVFQVRRRRSKRQTRPLAPSVATVRRSDIGARQEQFVTPNRVPLLLDDGMRAPLRVLRVLWGALLPFQLGQLPEHLADALAPVCA